MPTIEFLLAGILLALLFLVVVLIFKKSPTLNLQKQFDALMDTLREESFKHVQLESLMALIERIESLGSDELEMLRTYPKSVRAAALLHAASTLSKDLKYAQDVLSRALRYGDNRAVERAQARVDLTQAKLNAVVTEAEYASPSLSH